MIMGHFHPESKTMYPPPSTPVYVWVGLVRHFGIVSDRWWNGEPMVISHSFRRGGTFEEPWSVFHGGRQVYVASERSSLEPWIVLARARSWIGQRAWSLFLNCEHHVRHALGRESSSPQLRGALSVLAGVALVAVGNSGGRRGK